MLITRRSFRAVCLLGGFYGLLSCAPVAPRVEVAGETLVGNVVENGEVTAFLGVPFAEPPVGDLRWQEPQPLRQKLGRRSARSFAPACLQTMRILEWYRYMAETFGGSADYYDDLRVSEDCLYLNIWTSTLGKDAKQPVMVYFHGGSNISGWSYEPNYHGQLLAKRGVVIVTIAYRLGVFGFYSHPEMAGQSAEANFGFWDQVAALRWVQDNIGLFGGDPDRVTLFGESSGASDILVLLASEAADGLFHRAILQSAGDFGTNAIPSLAEERERGLKLAAAFGFDASGSLEQLRKVPAEQVLATYVEAGLDTLRRPTIDGQLLRQMPWDAIHDGRFRNVPIIIGTNADEYLDSVDVGAKQADLEAALAKLQHLDPDKALAIVAAETDPRRAIDRLITADDYLCTAQHLAGAMNRAGIDAWMYFFSRIRDGAGAEKLRAYHGAEYPYIFGIHDDYMTTSEIDVFLTRTMQDYWTNFAATGNPNSKDSPDWPTFSAPGHPVQELGDTVFTRGTPEPELCALFEAWEKAYRSAEP